MKASFQAIHGAITSSHIALASNESEAQAESDKIAKAMVGKKVYEIGDWNGVFQEIDAFKNRDQATKLSNWLNGLFGNR